MPTIASYNSKIPPSWCPGCGNFSIQLALKQALLNENLEPHNVVLCFDVGCNGNGADKIRANTIKGLHGRAIPLGAGAALANPKMKIISSSGDGATFSEGVNHLVHAVRSNYPMVFLHHNNGNFALTTGQPSSLSKKGTVMNSAPDGVILDPINPINFVMSLNPSFVARTYSGDIRHMTGIFQQAIKHNGFAFIDILQLCPTYNRESNAKWFGEHIKYLDEKHDSTDFSSAKSIAEKSDTELYLGLIYKDPSSKNFLEKIS